MKLKRLLALVGGGVFSLALNSAFAQTDVTSTYLTNADFEGEATSYQKPKSDRDIYQPTGWNISYTNGNENDVTSLGESTTQWNQFSGKPQPTNGGSKAYWMRYRWGSSENITLTQETRAALPAGTYCVSVDSYSDDNTGNAIISVEGVSQTVRANGAWANYKVVFTLASEKKVTISLSYTNTAADDHAAAFDNVKILDVSNEPTGITLKNVLGGTSANLADFNVWYNDYTLEVEGTAGTEIRVTADNISYTPETTGTIRFVKKNGIVYVFEGTTYKKAVYSTKADYVYNRKLSKDNPTTDNFLENPSFETLGSSVGTDIYNIGTPWTSNVTMGPGGIRVGKSGSAQHGSYVLVWRGSGNNNYFSQEIASLPQYKGYKVCLQQIASGNANANFNVGLGNAAGDYSYLSNTVKLGTDQDGEKNIVLGANGDMPAAGVYFTFRNTSNNTASSGKDPVTQIDWIGLVGSDDFPITGVSSASYVYGMALAPATAKSSYLAAKAEAEATIADATYTNVTGEERTNLQSAIDADVADNDAAYDTATENIQDAANAFTSALSHYQALIDAQAAVPNLAYASAEKAAFKTAVATSASDADTKVAEMPTKIRAYYESHALAEGVSNAVNKTSLLANPDAMKNNDGWVWTGVKNYPKNNQPWTDGSGSASHWYFDGGDWNNSSWTTTMSQTITLPAGTYLLTAKGRAATNTTLTLAAGEDNVALPHVGSAGNVFDRGWGDASVKFTTDSEGDVEIKVTATSSTVHEWFSVGDFRLVRLDATLADATDYDKLIAAISTAEAKTLGFEDGEYAPYSNAAVLTKLAEAKAIDKDVNNEQSDVQALTNYLDDAANWTANSGDVDAIFNGSFSSDVEGDGGLTGWTRTNPWGQQQTGLPGDYATAYYNQPGSLQYGKQGVYTMPLKASQLYKLTFAYRSHDAINPNKGVTVSVKNGDEGLASATFPANGSTSDWKVVDAYFTTGAAGNYVLTLANDGNTWMTGVSLVKAEESELALAANPTKYTYYQDASFDRTFSTTNYSTLVLPFALTDEEKKAAFEEVYELNAVEGQSIKLAEATEIAAGKPYLVKAKTAKLSVTNKALDPSTTVSNTEQSDASSTVTFVGRFSPVVLTAAANANAYVVSNSTLYQVTSDVTVKAYRGYFTVVTTNGVKNFVLDFGNGETTSIEALESETGDKVIYNLAGQRVQKAQKGVFIVNGKKVVIK